MQSKRLGFLIQFMILLAILILLIINEAVKQSKYVNANEGDLPLYRGQNAFILQDEGENDSKGDNNNSNTNSNC